MMAGRRPTILLVQPDRDDRTMYIEFLRYAGLMPFAFSTAAAALRVARDMDVIVTDTMLPGPMDGMAFVARLKRDVHTKHIPIIALTTCAWESERERALHAGCDLFLTKPCLPDVLAGEIKRLLPRVLEDGLRREQFHRRRG
jgi:CheY-like chemotaxis protein